MNRFRVVLVLMLVLIGLVAAAYFLDPDRRLEANVRGLPTFENRAATAWATELAAPDATTRSVAFDRLKNGQADATPVLVWLLAHGGEPRRQAADILGQLGEAGRPAVPALLTLLDDPDPFIRTTAYKGLARFAPPPNTPLPPELDSVVPTLVKHLPDVEAIRVISTYRTHAAAAVPDLMALLDHLDEITRWNAARTLGKIGPAAMPALPQIVRQFTDPAAPVREHAAEAAGDIGPPAASCAPELVKLLDDPDWKVRRDTVRALGNFGPAAVEQLPAVLKSKTDPQTEVRAAATLAARKIDPTQPPEPVP